MIGLETMAIQEGGSPDASILASIEWIDWTAIVILSVFFVMGLFKGFVWQASRMLSLVAGFVVAGVYGERGAAVIHRWFGGGAPVSGATVYLAYVVIFLAVVVVLSLMAYFIQKLVRKSGLGFYDRVCGGFLGVATGACVMIFILSIIYMFLDDFAIAEAARRSKSMTISQKTLRTLGDVVPRPMQQVFGVEEARPRGEAPDQPQPDQRGPEKGVGKGPGSNMR